jgi:transposase InsO family protein
VIWAGDTVLNVAWEGRTVTIDLYSRKVVGWELSKSLNRALALSALRQALLTRSPDSNLMIHTDRGSQYTSDEFIELDLEDQSTLSLSRRGNCWDNVVVESFFATLKRERISGERIVSRRHLHYLLTDYIESYYNQIRLHSTLDYLSPSEYELIYATG